MQRPNSTARGNAPYARLRRAFFGVFIVSTAIFLLLWFLGFGPSLLYGGSGTPTAAPTPFTTASPMPSTTTTPAPEGTVSASATPGLATSEPPGSASFLPTLGGLIAIVTSCLTSLTTFVGFVITTAIGLRKEGRDARDAEIERLKKEVELEKQRAELEKQKVELEQLRKSGKAEDTEHKE